MASFNVYIQCTCSFVKWYALMEESWEDFHHYFQLTDILQFWYVYLFIYVLVWPVHCLHSCLMRMTSTLFLHSPGVCTSHIPEGCRRRSHSSWRKTWPTSSRSKNPRKTSIPWWRKKRKVVVQDPACGSGVLDVLGPCVFLLSITVMVMQ